MPPWRSNPDLHEAWGARGFSLAELGRYDEAITSYDKSLEYNSDLDISVYLKACCYAKWHKAEEAIQALGEAIRLEPGYRERVKTEASFDGIRGEEGFRALMGD
ncbi:TPR subfamily 2 repeat-containing protein [Leptolyngbya sp. PCC 7375]|nr:TPR subfamily 2 repeat-containing protein [Leptolyngbya sp. PCC 7375]